MFISIYPDGIFYTNPSIETAFALPGKYYVFSLGKYNNKTFNDPEGISYYETPNERKLLRIKDLEFIHLENDKQFYVVGIYDYKIAQSKKIKLKFSSDVTGLVEAVKYIVLASEFPNIESYEQTIKALQLDEENKNLLLQIEQLKIENEELKNRSSLS